MKKLFLMLLLAIIALSGCQGPTTEKPLIGITSVYQVNEYNDLYSLTVVPYSYIRAITESGGTPIVLPTVADNEMIAQYINTIDGLLIIGGDDIPPAAYGQKTHETVVAMPPKRYNFERKLIPAWLRTKKPTLGICLGMQFTNVASGGTMIQDIPSYVDNHVNHRGKKDLHIVKIDKDSKLADILGKDKVYVYSNHHQAVNKIGKNLKVVARAPDGVAESLERTNAKFGIFVQWHPELMEDTKHRDAIYSAFVDACR